MTCMLCGDGFGSYVICEDCAKGFRRLSKSTQRRVWHAYHEWIRSTAPEDNGALQCFHCEGWFAWEQICGDHWPDPKSVLPYWERFNVERSKPSCGICNTNPSLRKRQGNTP